MLTLSPRLLTLAVALGLTAVSFAQAQGETIGVAARDRAKNSPAFLASKKADAVAGPLLLKARQRLRERKLTEAESLASEVVLVYADVHERSIYANDILAESYLLRGQPALALEELGGASPLLPSQMYDKKDGGMIVSDRGALTRAIALARLGRLEAAHAILDENVPDLRITFPKYRLPMDGDDSAKALEATACLLRSSPGSVSGPDTLEDLRDAVRLAPTCGAAHSFLSQCLLDRHDLDGALAEAERALALARTKEAKEFAARAEMLRKAVARRNRQRGS